MGSDNRHSDPKIAKPNYNLVDDFIKGAYILAVDDFSAIRRIIVNTFRARDAYVDEASNGLIALDKMFMAVENNTPYDIVFMDIEMPVMDGIEFLTKLRQDKGIGDTPVIMFSSHADSEEINECIRLGITDYIIKPATRERLYRAVTKALSDRQRRGTANKPQAVMDIVGEGRLEYAKVIFRKLETIEKLPVLPLVLDKIKDLTSDPNSNNERIAAIMKDEPSLMANVFKLANSALYGAREPIDSLQAAITRLGLNAVNNMVTSMAVLAVLNHKMEGFDHRKFCEHSIGTGIAMCVLYEFCRAKISTAYQKDLLHLAGLLHDIGKIIVIQFFHDEFLQAIEFGKKEGIPMFVAEQRAMGVDHTEVGAWLGRKWGLSSVHLSAIRCHHAPLAQATGCDELVMLCHCANYICNLQRIGDGGDTLMPIFDQRVFDRLGLKVDDIPNIVKRIKQEAQMSEILMSFLD